MQKLELWRVDDTEMRPVAAVVWCGGSVARRIGFFCKLYYGQDMMCPTQTISLHTTVVVGTFSLLKSRRSTILLLTLIRRIVTRKHSSVPRLSPKVLDSVSTSSLQGDGSRARGACSTFSGRPRMEELEVHALRSQDDLGWKSSRRIPLRSYEDLRLRIEAHSSPLARIEVKNII